MSKTGVIFVIIPTHAIVFDFFYIFQISLLHLANTNSIIKI